ncbi:hypothetical protein SORBI_3002G157400 [Sorghum bicolor]|uniref:Uncharacterized protein n=2 Tax=Sorghum bicolor TaxID=4558 RepID=A0A1B6QBL7_SORBI|nr:hypothetical protein SORBI_3002G157400 [Sorghum bicolor]
MASSSGRPSPVQPRVRPSPLELGFGNPSASHNPSIEDRVALLLRASHDGYVPKIKTLAKRLKEHAGMSVDEAVRWVQAPWSKRHGPLHMAAAAGKFKACKYLIKDLGLDVNATGTDGATPLVFAIHGSGSLAVVRLLLDHDANPNRADIYGSYPLHIAAIRGYYEISELLLSKGAYADPQWKSKSPLYIAAQCGNARMVELLLHHDAEPKHVVYTPLKAAISGRSLIGLELLIKAGAPVNIGLPETPLVEAAAAGLTDFVKCLLKAGANANIPDDNGRVAVEIAAIQGWQECVEVLFPVTAPLARVADWSIDGLLQYARSISSKTQHPVLHEDHEPDYEAEGDATFCRRDYSHASNLYTMAMEIDPDNSTLYAKRSLCFLYTGYEGEALEDATTYKDMHPNLSKSCYEQGAALILVKEYGRTCEALLPGLISDF